MNNKYFYIIVTLVTVLLCLPGCNETNIAETETTKSSEIISNTDNNDEQLSSETTVTTLTPLQTFERITALKKDVTENDETEKITKTSNKKTDEERVSPKDTDITDGWFSAHTMFKINTIEDDSRFDGTWYHFSFDENNETTSSTVVESNRFNIDISGNENNE